MSRTQSRSTAVAVASGARRAALGGRGASLAAGALSAALGLPLAAAYQTDRPPAPVRVPGVVVAQPRSVLATIESADAVERELVARAIALGEVERPEVAALLDHADWTLRHLALDALGRLGLEIVSLAGPYGNELDRAFSDPRVELRVAATRVGALEWTSSSKPRVHSSDDPSPEVRLALARALASLVSSGPLRSWKSPTELVAPLLDGSDAAAELARRVAWTTGPSEDSLPHANRSLDWGRATWIENQPESALAPGAWTEVAREFSARCGGDPWSTVVTCFEECLAQDDWRRGPIAHMLRDLAATPAERTIAIVLAAHLRPLTPDEAALLAAGAPDLCARFGTDDPARVLLPAARLAPSGLASAFLATLQATSGDTRELLVRCAAEALGPAGLAELALDTDVEVLVASARHALVRGAAIPGAALAPFADHADAGVREAVFTLAVDALSNGRAAMAVPLLERMLTDPEPDLAAAAFRALAGSDVAQELEARLHVAWRALPDEATRLARLRDLSRTARWPSFEEDLIRQTNAAHPAEYVELLVPLADEPRVRDALARWFDEDVAALCAATAQEARFAFDGRAASLAHALHQARGRQLDGELTAKFERTLLATMQLLHPEGARSRAKLPKALVAFLGIDPAGRAALERVLVAAAPRAPRRVRTEAAIVLAERLGRRRGGAHGSGDTAARGTRDSGQPEPVQSAGVLDVLVDALVDAVHESEPELAVRAVQAFDLLPEPARKGGVARLLEQWDALGGESVRIALTEVAAEDPTLYRTLQRISEGASDDTVAGALIEAMAAAEHGRAESLAALQRFEAALSGPAERGGDRARAPAPELTAEQALVRREAVLLGFARSAEPLPEEVAARVFARPLALARSDLFAAFQGEWVAGAEFRFRGELALGEALARERRLGACLGPRASASATERRRFRTEAPLEAWWEVDADFLTALARRAAPHEPDTAARLAEAALVAHMGLPEPRREREGRATRTELLALWFSAELAAGELRDAAEDSPAEAELRAAHLDRAASVASELVGSMALTNLERSLATRDRRALDLRTVERSFGAIDSSLGVDPRARLCAAVQQLPLLAMLERGDMNAFAWAIGFERSVGRGRADWLARSREARALEDRLDSRIEAETEKAAKEWAEEHRPR